MNFLLVSLGFKTAAQVIGSLRGSKKHEDVLAAQLIENATLQLERIVQAKVYLKSLQTVIPPELEVLFGMFLNEAQRTAESSMRTAASLAEADVNVAAIIEEAGNEVERLLREGNGPVSGQG